MTCVRVRPSLVSWIGFGLMHARALPDTISPHGVCEREKGKREPEQQEEGTRIKRNKKKKEM